MATLAFNETTFSNIGLAKGPVPGAQTAPRAEAWATYTLAVKSEGASLTVMQDPEYAVDGMRKLAGGGAAADKLLHGWNHDICRF